MTRRVASAGVYQDEAGGYWVRPWIHGRRTWRKLKALKLAAAQREAGRTEWVPKAKTFAELVTLYRTAGHPDRRLEESTPAQIADEQPRLESILEYFGRMKAAEIRIAHLPAYRKWRLARIKRKVSGERTVDLDTNTLSRVLQYGVSTGLLEFNYIRTGRPRFRKDADVRHARDVAPPDADTLHKLADSLFAQPRSEVLGWQVLLGAFTGCRTSELLRLRLDARPGEPGHVEGDRLHLGRRSKGGVNPFAIIGPEFRALLDAHGRWHRLKKRSPFYLPGKLAGEPVSENALGHALRRLCTRLKLRPITPHGLRSFYVTKRRSDGASDPQIAGEIGDQTATLMQTTYGARPDNWTGGKDVSWLPSHGQPAWARWNLAKKAVRKAATGLKVDSLAKPALVGKPRK
jgi:integrase